MNRRKVREKPLAWVLVLTGACLCLGVGLALGLLGFLLQRASATEVVTYLAEEVLREPQKLDRLAEFLTQARLVFLQTVAAVGASGLIWVGVWLLRTRKKRMAWLSAHLLAPSQWPERRQFLHNKKKGQTGLMLVGLAFGIGSAVSLARALPVTVDEANVWNTFVSRGFWVSLSYWPIPSNHFPHTLSAWAVSQLGASHLWALRLPSLCVFGLTLLGLGWHVWRRNGLLAALIVLLLLGSQYLTSLFGGLGRGYAFQLLATAVLWVASTRALAGNFGMRWRLITALALATGVWAAPSYALLVAVWGVGLTFLLPRAGRKAWLGTLVVAALLSGLLLAPALLVSGLTAFQHTAEAYVGYQADLGTLLRTLNQLTWVTPPSETALPIEVTLRFIFWATLSVIGPKPLRPFARLLLVTWGVLLFGPPLLQGLFWPSRVLMPVLVLELGVLGLALGQFFRNSRAPQRLAVGVWVLAALGLAFQAYVHNQGRAFFFFEMDHRMAQAWGPDFVDDRLTLVPHSGHYALVQYYLRQNPLRPFRLETDTTQYLDSAYCLILDHPLEKPNERGFLLHSLPYPLPYQKGEAFRGSRGQNPNSTFYRYKRPLSWRP